MDREVEPAMGRGFRPDEQQVVCLAVGFDVADVQGDAAVVALEAGAGRDVEVDVVMILETGIPRTEPSTEDAALAILAEEAALSVDREGPGGSGGQHVVPDPGQGRERCPGWGSRAEAYGRDGHRVLRAGPGADDVGADRRGRGVRETQGLPAALEGLGRDRIDPVLEGDRRDGLSRLVEGVEIVCEVEGAAFRVLQCQTGRAVLPARERRSSGDREDGHATRGGRSTRGRFSPAPAGAQQPDAEQGDDAESARHRSVARGVGRHTQASMTVTS